MQGTMSKKSPHPNKSARRPASRYVDLAGISPEELIAFARVYTEVTGLPWRLSKIPAAPAANIATENHTALDKNTAVGRFVEYHSAVAVRERVNHNPDTVDIEYRRIERSPLPTSVEYSHITRHAVVDNIVNKILTPYRTAVLLAPTGGGGRALARQVVQSYIENRHSNESALKERLDANQRVRMTTPDAPFSVWVSNTADATAEIAEVSRTREARDALIVVDIADGNGDRLDADLGTSLERLRQTHAETMVIITGGERILRLREQNRTWAQLLPGTCLFDVPDLTEDEAAAYLQRHGINTPEQLPLIKLCGGSLGLLQRMTQSGNCGDGSVDAALKYVMQIDRRFDRHLHDPEARAVLQRLVRDQPVASLHDPAVRHHPSRFAEARLYFDGILRWDEDGKTIFRSPVARDLVVTLFDNSNL